VAPVIDLGSLGFGEGAHLLLKRALRAAGVGDCLTVTGSAPDLETDLRAWCRVEGHHVQTAGGEIVIRKGGAEEARWAGAERAGDADFSQKGAVRDFPSPRWGLAARGALVEEGAPEFHFSLSAKDEVWSDDAARLYAQAVAAQWDPAAAIPWEAGFELPEEVEDAVVQVMTYLIENETAALIVPSRFIARLHPHFREVMQLLAVQAADEARHIEVFTRRALLRRSRLGLSTTGGQASLKTLVEEPDFAIASFLLSVLGEGTFLSLLRFLELHAPDPVTSAVARLAAQDEARHVAFGMAHLRRHAQADASLLPRLAAAIRRRHDALQSTSGLNAEVFDALLLLAAGAWDTESIRHGHLRLMELTAEMQRGREQRLVRLGFGEKEAEDLAALHTRNFM